MISDHVPRLSEILLSTQTQESSHQNHIRMFTRTSGIDFFSTNSTSFSPRCAQTRGKTLVIPKTGPNARRTLSTGNRCQSIFTERTAHSSFDSISLSTTPWYFKFELKKIESEKFSANGKRCDKAVERDVHQDENQNDSETQTLPKSEFGAKNLSFLSSWWFSSFLFHCFGAWNWV